MRKHTTPLTTVHNVGLRSLYGRHRTTPRHAGWAPGKAHSPRRPGQQEQDGEPATGPAELWPLGTESRAQMKTAEGSVPTCHAAVTSPYQA